MVKADFRLSGSKHFQSEGEEKLKAELLEEAGSNRIKITENKQTKIEDGEVVLVENDTAISRRRPKTCAFICFFVLVLVVGFLTVFLIGRKNIFKSHDVNLLREALEPPTAESANVTALWKDVSWETREELFQLADSIEGESIILGLTPIYRKDLPRNYIAYWELKFVGKNGEKYVILSAGKQTGDYRLAEEGTLPSPTDKLRKKAKRRGYKCHKIFRISPDGLMVCEDITVHNIVASTRDWESSIWDDKWTTLDYQVSRELPLFKKEWEALARRMRRLPEWKRFKWVTGLTDPKPTTRPTRGNLRPAMMLCDFKGKWQNLYGQGGYESDCLEAELGMRPGQSVRIPIGRDFRGVRVKFVGFGYRRGKKRSGWSKRWQKKVCRVLCDLCEEDEWGDSTQVKPKFLKRTSMGDNYLHVKVHSDNRFVRRLLHGQDIRFRVELKLDRKTYIVLQYGVILKSRHRGPRHVQLNEYIVPQQGLVPDYRQYKLLSQCLTGSGPLAWATLFGYYDNLAHKAPHLGYKKTHFALFGDRQVAPLISTPQVKALIEEIFHSLDTYCVPSGFGLTKPVKMQQIRDWYRSRFGANLNLIVRYDKNATSVPTSLAIKLLKEGTPVIVSREGWLENGYSFAVASALRQRSNSYRLCAGAECSGWTTVTESEIFLHEGFDGSSGRWETADTAFAAAVLKENA